MGKVSMRLERVAGLEGEEEARPLAPPEATTSLLVPSGDEVAVEVELALRPLSASRVTECEDGRRAMTV